MQTALEAESLTSITSLTSLKQSHAISASISTYEHLVQPRLLPLWSTQLIHRPRTRRRQFPAADLDDAQLQTTLSPDEQSEASPQPSQPGKVTPAASMGATNSTYHQTDVAPAQVKVAAKYEANATARSSRFDDSPSAMPPARPSAPQTRREGGRQFVDLTDDESTKPLRFVIISEAEARRLSGLPTKTQSKEIIDLTDDSIDESSQPKVKVEQPDSCTICMDDLPLSGKEVEGEVLQCPWCTNCMHWACFRPWRDRQNNEGRDGSACPQCKQDFGEEASTG